jgi:hypothetical protein
LKKLEPSPAICDQYARFFRNLRYASAHTRFADIPAIATSYLADREQLTATRLSMARILDIEAPDDIR